MAGPGLWRGRAHPRPSSPGNPHRRVRRHRCQRRAALERRWPCARHRRRRGVLLMLLAIDAGNTNIVFALYEGDKMRAQWRAGTQGARPADAYGVWLSQLLALEGLAFADLKSAIIATVVPAVLFDLRQLCRKYLNTEPLLV